MIHSQSRSSYPGFAPGSLAVMHSDGLTTHWPIDRYADVGRDPTLIAAVLYRDFHRGRDDATRRWSPRT